MTCPLLLLTILWLAGCQGDREAVEGIAGLDGPLFFSSEGQTFSVHIQALWNGEAYRLSAVDELHLLGG